MIISWDLSFRCNADIEWMHCETTVDPDATYLEAWHALEKAYAEGYVMSIGVSNFDNDQLDELKKYSHNLPFLVQNFGTVGHLDIPVRKWCKKHFAIYQPYASVRNLAFMNSQIREKAQIIAQNHGVSEQAVNYKFFLQSGACSIIPRSTNQQHLEENLQLATINGWSLSPDDMTELGWNHLMAAPDPEPYDEL